MVIIWRVSRLFKKRFLRIFIAALITFAVVSSFIGGDDAEEVFMYYDIERVITTELQDGFILGAIKILDSSNGVILNIKDRFDDNDWRYVTVLVSKGWYNGSKAEQEKFVEYYGERIKSLIHSYEMVNEGEEVFIVFEDESGQMVAEEQVNGGYKIKY